MIDKSQQIQNLIEMGSALFFSRPPLFGQAELIAQLAEYFSGSAVITLDLRDVKQDLESLEGKVVLVEGYVADRTDSLQIVERQAANSEFLFVTGTGRLPLGSDLVDVSLEPEVATLVGLTETELLQKEAQLKLAAKACGLGGTELLVQMRRWFNWWRFSHSSKTERVFHPTSVQQFLEKGKFEIYAFGGEPPAHLVEAIQKKGLRLDEYLQGFQVRQGEEPGLLLALFDYGYLTLDRYNEVAGTYYLSPPNEEVRAAATRLFHPPSRKRNESVAIIGSPL